MRLATKRKTDTLFSDKQKLEFIDKHHKGNHARQQASEKQISNRSPLESHGPFS